MKKSKIILILGALTTIGPFSIDMYLPAFQMIATEFGTTTPRVSLSLSSYFIGLAFGQLFYGPFLDRFGRKPRNIGVEYFSILKNSQFLAYALSGAFSFAGLFAYLGAAPSIFMGTFHLSTKEFGAVFALLSIGMVGGAQFNIWLSRIFSVGKIFRSALLVQFIVGFIFLLGSLLNWYGFLAHVLVFYVYISCIGLTYPNGATLALSPFSKNRGSASALLGFLQMGIGAIASAGFGFLKFPAAISLGIIFLAAAGLALWNFLYLRKGTLA